MKLESHEPMKCHTENSIATLIPKAVGLLLFGTAFRSGVSDPCFFSGTLSLICLVLSFIAWASSTWALGDVAQVQPDAM